LCSHKTVGVSAGVIILSLALAFSTWIRTVIGFGLDYIYTTVEDWLGWRHKKANYSSTAIKNIQAKRQKALESRDHARRLTEINSRQASNLKKNQRMQKRSTWDVRRIADGPLSRIRNRNVPEGQDSV
jgi:hypothetical protein